MVAEHGEPLGRFITNRLARMVRQTRDSCLDNRRIAVGDTPEVVAAYEAQRRRGCCGFADEVFTFTRDGVSTIVRIGFNYGH